RQAVGPEVAAQAEDELEYIAGMLEDADADPEELLEQVTEMLEGLGVAILTTSKGVMRARDAREQGVGGEFVCKVW
ncbi:MAG: 30S ribosomal protein S8, partial [Verrucomicrobiota bacterium]|nr:30S ribosomal protein S8 [Verrucomicrobiota bacterium]